MTASTMMITPTAVELTEPGLVQRVNQLARTQKRLPEDLLETAVLDYLDAVEEEAIHDETEAFWRQHEDLIVDYRDQYVAMRQGNVVDHDSDVSLLEARVRERFGLLPVLIAPVTPAPRHELHWRGGRIDRAGQAT